MNDPMLEPVAAKDVFFQAVQMPPGAEREAWLAEHCAHSASLRRRVDQWLAQADEDQTINPLDVIVEAFEPEATLLQSDTDANGQPRTKAIPEGLERRQIGPYKLLEQIGQGGFGTVYMAEQTVPVRRKVALKILKPGMDSSEVIARFEAERQALAMMDHPNIARIYDGGTTDHGRPYFVMELVRGIPVTDYCDEARLTTNERLTLFIDVCRAVQHAHQKGIIHRDLKPSNVLVTMHDDKAVVKVIDFGIAKALSQQLTDRTLFTGYQQMLGTPLYMSPEQAQMSGIDIDTRSDVYSLGVMLYELLTGTTPFDKGAISRASFDDMRRIIREQEPPRPSARITTMQAEARSTMADRRRIDQRRVSDQLRGELDWIVMKALEKDRNRRYESASAFAADVQRYLNNEQVQACPPTVLYRLTKLCRRYRGPMVTAAALALVLVMATGVSLSYALQAEEEKNKAIQSEQLAEKRLKQSRADFDLALKSLETIIQSVSSSEFAQLPGVDPVREDILNCAMRFFQEIIDKHDNDPWARMKQALAHSQIAKLHEGRGDSAAILRETDESIRILESVIAENPEELQFQQSLMYPLFTRLHSVRRTLPQRHADAERCLQIVTKCTEAGLMNEPETLALLYYKVAETMPDNMERAREYVEISIATSESHGLPPLPPTQIWLAELARDEGDLESAVRWYRRGIELYDAQATEVTGGSTIVPRWLSSVDTAKLARIHEQLNQPKQAEDSWRKAFETARQLNREFSADARAWQSLIDRTSELCSCLKSQGRQAEAAKLISEVLPELTAPSESIVSLLLLQAALFESLKDFEGAFDAIDKAIALAPDAASAYEERGDLQASQRDFDLALSDFDKAIELRPDVPYVYKRRAACNFRMSRFDQAMADLQKGIELEPDDVSNLSWISAADVAACADPKFQEGMLKLADRCVELNKESAASLIARAQLLAELGEWEKANEDLKKSIPQTAGSYYQQYQVALLSAKLGDQEGYKAQCQMLVDSTKATAKPIEKHFAAWTCALSINAVEDYTNAIALGRAAVEAEPTNSQFLNGLGAILMRAGMYAEAKPYLEGIVNSAESETTSKTYTHYFLALTEHHLGQADAARVQLTTANELADQEMAASVPWNRRLTIELLRKEAQALIGDVAE